MEIRKLNQLKVSNPYLRLGTDVSDLEKSIKTVGLIAPLVISEKNLILAGGRRYQALLNLGHTEAPVMVITQDELARELISIDENLVRKDLNQEEMEGHLRRAKEIYQALTPVEEEISTPDSETDSDDQQESSKVKKEVLPAAKFLQMVSDKTGLSPKQIHQAISRDELAAPEVKNARRKGELSITQTNEIVKLKKEDQSRVVDHLKHRPVREIKQFIKLAKTRGVDQAIQETPETPHAREFLEIEASLKKLKKQLKQLEMEGIELEDLPANSQALLKDIARLLPTEFSHQTQENEQTSAYQQ